MPTTYPQSLYDRILPQITLLTDRASYVTKFGKQPKPYEPNKPLKRWVDTSASQVSNTTYPAAWNRTLVGTDPTVVAPLTVMGADVVDVNIPGEYAYPQWIVAATPAIGIDVHGITWQISPNTLASEDQANQLAKELSGTAQQAPDSPSPQLFTVNWNGETRRFWTVVVGGKSYDVSSLIRMKYANGVGAPGHWDVSGGSPKWVADPQVVGDGRGPEVPIPIVPLADNEEVYQPAFGAPMVRLKEVDPATPTSASSPDVLAKLDAIQNSLNTIISGLHLA